MKKYLLIITTITFSLINKNARAQGAFYNYQKDRMDTWHIEIGANGLYNQNPGKSEYKAGLGAQLSAIYYPNSFVGITLTTGYDHLFGKKRTVNQTIIQQADFKFVPLKIGVRGFVLPTWYFAGEFGVGYASPEIAKQTDFAKTIAPGFGYDNPDNGLDISLRYENMHHRGNYVSMIALQIAYSIDLSGQ